MKIFKLDTETPFTKDSLCLTIGNFDGFHNGHQEILKTLKKISIDKKLFSAVMSFDPHPRSFFNKDVDNFNGASLDMSDDPSAPGLTMDNPNTPSPARFGNPEEMPELTGELAEKVQTVLESQINPAIASHGGQASLVGVEGQDIYLRLGGGCQGCGMAQVTLTQGIEKALRDAVPEIGNIIDATDHASGSNPYFESSKK